MRPQDFKRWRKALSLSQKEAAESLGLKRRVVQYYEKGERGGAKVKIPKTVRLACAALVQGVADYQGPDRPPKTPKPPKAAKPKSSQKKSDGKRPEDKKAVAKKGQAKGSEAKKPARKPAPKTASPKKATARKPPAGRRAGRAARPAARRKSASR